MFATLFALFAPAPARAQSSDPVALEWSAPPGCSSARDVLGRVRKLARSPTWTGRDLRVEATVAQAERGRLHLKMIVHAGDLVGERSIDGRSCDDLAGAAAVVLALLLNSEEPLRESDLRGGGGADASGVAASSSQAAQAPESAPVSQNTEPEPPEAAEAEEQAARDAARSGRRFRGVLQVPLVSVGFGPLPKPSFGFALAGGILFEGFSFLAEGSAWLKQTLTAPEDPESGADLHRIEASLRSCRAFLFGRFELAPCLRVSLEHMWARGTGPHIVSQTAKTTWVAAGLGGQTRFHLASWFSFFAGVDAQIGTSRPRIAIDGVGSLGQLRRGAVTITLGSEWIF